MWIVPRPLYSVSQLWDLLAENDFFQLLKTKPTNSFLGKLANLAVQASDQQPLNYRIVYKTRPHQQIVAVSNSYDIIKGHWKLLIDEILPKIIECDLETRDQFLITKISGLASCYKEEEEDQNDEQSLNEFKTQFDIDEKLVTYFTSTLLNNISIMKPNKGKIFITQQKICYYASNPVTRIMIPFQNVNSISKENPLGFLPSAIKIKACIGPDDKTVSEFSFHFILRDQAYDTLEQLWQYSMDQLYESTPQDLTDSPLPYDTNNINNSSSSYQDLQSIYSDTNSNSSNNNTSPTLKPKTKHLLDIEKKNRDFQKTFKLPSDEEYIQYHTCWIVRKNAVLGELYISPNFFCIKYKDRFTTKKFTTVIHVSEIESIQKTKPFLGISFFTDSLEITVKSGRKIIIRLFHFDEALNTMKKYCQVNQINPPNVIDIPSSPNYKEKLRLETIGSNLFSQEPSLIIEDEKIEKKKFELWDNYFKKNGMDSTMSITNKLQYLTHLGIPEFFRGHIWAFTSGACFMWEKEKGYYENILKENENNTSVAIEEIEKDIRRTYAHHPYFKEDQPGISALRRILVAYSWRNPAIGYCQGMNIVAAIMLLYMKEEAAFWVLCKVVENYLDGYHGKEMIGSIVDQNIFDDLCKLYLPEVYHHLNKIGLPLRILTLPWFMCLFVSYIPYQVSTRVIDCLFLDGTTVLFQAGLAILKINKNAILAERDSEVVVELLRNKKYNIDELIDVTFRDFDILEEKINELRNSLKFTEIKRNYNIKKKLNSLNNNNNNNSGSNNNSENSSPIISNIDDNNNNLTTTTTSTSISPSNTIHANINSSNNSNPELNNITQQL